MPSQYFRDQTILFSIGIQGHYWAIGASGRYLLPYLRACHTLGQSSPDIRTLIKYPHPLDPNRLHRWIGTLYVEYQQDDDLIANPTRVECSGCVHEPTSHEISSYFVPTGNPLIGPIGLQPYPFPT